MESSPALRDYAVRKLERIVGKYVRGSADASIVMTAEPFGHVADFKISIKNTTVKGKAQSHDMYSSIDLALEKIEKQLRRHKDRARDHYNTNGNARAFNMGVLAPVGGSPTTLVDDSDVDGDFAEDFEKFPAPEEEELPEEIDGQEVVMEAGDGSNRVMVLRNREYQAEPMTVENAVRKLQNMEDEQEFYVFNNVDSNRLSIVYRRNDDNIGLIEMG
jgi:putative sigma-54 modulation protein